MVQPVAFAPSRTEGLRRLEAFAAQAGPAYAARRNYDLGPQRRTNVSCLSPWIRHRLITEREVLTRVLQSHDLKAAEKFVQEVVWRGYFKGWLEHRPAVWQAYQSGRDRALAGLRSDRRQAAQFAAATQGETGIEGFDDWARELIETGYLHNHARMWFASIWIFTLRLPWELGADFFLRHLADGDPASNTLSWRWVAGLHTRGKAYTARPSNIATYTGERFAPQGLADPVTPLHEAEPPAPKPIPPSDTLPQGDHLLLVTEEDCHLGAELPRAPAAVLGLCRPDSRSPLGVGEVVRGFCEGAVADGVARISRHHGVPDRMLSAAWQEALVDAARDAGVRHVLTAYAPVGPVADALSNLEPTLNQAGMHLVRVRRRYDDILWPHATKGFFKMKMKIPQMLAQLDLIGPHADLAAGSGGSA
ncbi:MAG: DNA photolyase [Paracoccaceae bacterium]